jgi:hypothetical protein
MDFTLTGQSRTTNKHSDTGDTIHSSESKRQLIRSKQTHLPQSKVPNTFSHHKLVFTDKQTTHQQPTAADEKHRKDRFELGQGRSWSSSHATPHGLLHGRHHDKDGVSIVESRVGNPAAQLASLLAEGARVAEVVGRKVTDSL